MHTAELAITVCVTSLGLVATSCCLEATESFVSRDLGCFVILVLDCLFQLKRGIRRSGGELIVWLRPVGKAFRNLENILICDAHGSEVSHVVVAVDLFEGSVLVSEVASLSIWAELLSVELSAVL